MLVEGVKVEASSPDPTTQTRHWKYPKKTIVRLETTGGGDDESFLESTSNHAFVKLEENNFDKFSTAERVTRRAKLMRSELQNIENIVGVRASNELSLSGAESTPPPPPSPAYALMQAAPLVVDDRVVVVAAKQKKGPGRPRKSVDFVVQQQQQPPLFGSPKVFSSVAIGVEAQQQQQQLGARDVRRPTRARQAPISTDFVYFPTYSISRQNSNRSAEEDEGMKRPTKRSRSSTKSTVVFNSQTKVFLIFI